MKGLISHILMFLIEHADLDIHASDTPVGKRIGGHDIPELKDKFLDLRIGEAGEDFVGYWQYK